MSDPHTPATTSPDIDIRITGRAGRITLTREAALNALTYDMCLAVDAALLAWRDDPRVACVVMDASGDKAFCAGGDIAQLYERGTAGDYAHGQMFWRDEYRMNARINAYPKPVVSFLQGFTMGGGVGLGCQGSHRIVGETSRISMPEVGIGLVPDVGGSYLLAQAPGALGCYLGLTADRMGPADALLAGFADLFIPKATWPALIETLETSGEVTCLSEAACPAPDGTFDALRAEIDRHFSAPTFAAIQTSLAADDSDFAARARKAMARHAPLSMACTVAMLQQLRAVNANLRDALKQEYRFTYRAQAQADFLEGIRALIIDKDKCPKWRFADGSVPEDAVAAMLAPLGGDELTFEEA